eukprot:Skav236632  [mRNA]  locus=scaffold2276:135226:137460:+ [translate_table: standard]
MLIRRAIGLFMFFFLQGRYLLHLRRRFDVGDGTDGVHDGHEVFAPCTIDEGPRTLVVHRLECSQRYSRCHWRNEEPQ